MYFCSSFFFKEKSNPRCMCTWKTNIKIPFPAWVVNGKNLSFTFCFPSHRLLHNFLRTVGRLRKVGLKGKRTPTSTKRWAFFFWRKKITQTRADQFQHTKKGHQGFARERSWPRWPPRGLDPDHHKSTQMQRIGSRKVEHWTIPCNGLIYYSAEISKRSCTFNLCIFINPSWCKYNLRNISKD